MLEEYLAKAKKGELQSIIIGFVRVDGGAAVQSTPMSPVMMNHLSTLLERRVAREYDRALAQANSARGGTGAGAVPEMPRQSPAAQLPRKVRRAVQQRQKNLQQLAEKKAKQQKKPEPVIRRPPEVT
jgi:hypothetical protein